MIKTCPDCGSISGKRFGVVPIEGRDLCGICAVRSVAMKPRPSSRLSAEVKALYDSEYLLSAQSMIYFDQLVEIR